MIALEHPVLTDEELAQLREHRRCPGFESAHALRCSSRWRDGGDGPARGARRALPRGRARPSRDGVNILILLGPRRRRPDLAPIPMLLATGAVHHHLIREGTRTRCGLVVETGEAREVAHFALLIGYGAGAINPYLALRDARRAGRGAASTCPRTSTSRRPIENYIKADRQGPAQDLREDGHLDAAELPRRADLRGDRPRSTRSSSATSPGHASRVEGVGLDVIAQEAAMRHDRAFPGDGSSYPRARCRAASTSGARAASSTPSTPTRSRKLQHAVRSGAATRRSRSSPKRPTTTPSALCTLRGLLEFKHAGEPGAARRGRAGRRRSCKRFCTGAMSLRLDLARGARDARDRDEPHRRQEQHRRGRRGSEPLHAGRERRLAAQRDQAGRVGALRRDELRTSSTPTRCRSRWRRAPSPARAAQLPGHKVDETIAKHRATRRRASG